MFFLFVEMQKALKEKYNEKATAEKKKIRQQIGGLKSNEAKIDSLVESYGKLVCLKTHLS